MTFERKQKYLVLKLDDIEKYLNDSEKRWLNNCCDLVGKGRMSDGKKENSYVVVNQDEPYAEEVWKLIEEGEKNGSGKVL